MLAALPRAPISCANALGIRCSILKVGDDAVHGETAYAIGVEGE
jgi:hypothetical protein